MNANFYIILKYIEDEVKFFTLYQRIEFYTITDNII